MLVPRTDSAIAMSPERHVSPPLQLDTSLTTTNHDTTSLTPHGENTLMQSPGWTALTHGRRFSMGVVSPIRTHHPRRSSRSKSPCKSPTKSPKKAIASPTRTSTARLFPLFRLFVALHPPSLARVKVLLQQTEGRDKLLKLVQYSCKLLVNLPTTTFHARAEKLTSSLSVTRKMMRLGHAYEGYQEAYEWMTSEKTKNWFAKGHIPWTEDDAIHGLHLLSAVLGIASDVSDDVVALAKIGVLDKQHGNKAEPLAARFWMSGILIDLFDNFTTTKRLQKQWEQTTDQGKRQVLQKKLVMQRVSALKLLADFGFCTYDVFHIERFAVGQTCCGWLAACLSLYKLWVKTA